ncbi:MAG: DNRLRE domain-containing protein [Phycisphaerales bacterium]
MRTRTPLTLAAAALVAAPACADLVSIKPAQDNTLYEENPEFSNALGPGMFTGTISAGWHRRAMVMFDVAAFVPAGSTIDSVTLTVRCTRARGGSYPVGLHRLASSWGEGGSNAGDPGGGGTSATIGDATWSHRLFGQPGELWTTPGGDFSLAPASSVNLGSTGSYTWPSTAQFIAEVQAMLDNPGANHGWAIIGNEAASGTAKRLATREHSNAAYHPTLTIAYTPIPAPGPAGVLALASIFAARRRRA